MTFSECAWRFVLLTVTFSFYSDVKFNSEVHPRDAVDHNENLNSRLLRVSPQPMRKIYFLSHLTKHSQLYTLLKVQIHSYEKRCFGSDVQESDVHLL